MAKELPYYRWWPKDAESDAKYSSMTLAELGLFHRCLNYSWINGGVASDLAEMARELRLPERDIRHLWPRVSRCFGVVGVDERIRNERQEKERMHAEVKSERATKSVRTRYERSYERNTNVPTNDLPVRYGSVYESVSVDSKKENEAQNSEPPLDEDEVTQAHERHRKQRAGHSLNMAVQMIIHQGGKFNMHRFRERHKAYCDYWERADWRFCPLSLCEWLENGMPEPPVETAPVQTARESKADEMIRVANERVLRTGRL